MSFVAYHGYPTANHKTFADQYLGLGYKYLTLSIYGTPQHPLFAGVLLPGFAPHVQREFHSMNASQFANRFNTELKLGWGPVMVVATGPAGSERYAAVFEKMSTIPYTRNRLTAAEFDSLNASARVSDPAKSVNPSTILSWAGVHGTKADPRYIGIWSANPKRIVWNVSRLNPADDQHWFDASNHQWARAIFSVYSPDLDEYVSLYRDDAPIDYLSDPAMKPDDYQKRFDTLSKDGYIPTCVQGSGEGNALITPIWTRSGRPAIVCGTLRPDRRRRRAWRLRHLHEGVHGEESRASRGRGRGEGHQAGARSRLHLRGTSVSGHASGQHLPHRQLQQADYRRRHAATQRVEQRTAQTERHDLQPAAIRDSREYARPELPEVGDGGRFALHDRRLRWLDHVGAERREHARPAELSRQQDPAGAGDDPDPGVDGAPGTSEHYSNLSYSLLGLLLEKKTGTTYADYVQAHILEKFKGPGNTWRPRLDVAATGAQPAGAVLQHASDAANGRTILAGQVSDPTRPFVPFVYGGADYSTYDAYGGWCMAGVDFAAFLATMNRNPCPYFKNQATLALLSKQNKAYGTTLAGKSLKIRCGRAAGRSAASWRQPALVGRDPERHRLLLLAG